MEEKAIYKTEPEKAGWDNLNPPLRGIKPERKKEKVIELEFLAKEETKKEETKKETLKKKPSRRKEGEAVQENFKLLLSGVFSIAGSINPIWIVQESEIDLVVSPASRIFERYVAEKADEVSDVVALTIALGVMLIPRIVLTISMKKEEKQDGSKKETARSPAVATPKFADSLQGGSGFTG